MLNEDKKTGYFPLISENRNIGCLVAKSTEGEITAQEIYYLHQLAKQTATTITRANAGFIIAIITVRFYRLINVRFSPRRLSTRCTDARADCRVSRLSPNGSGKAAPSRNRW